MGVVLLCLVMMTCFLMIYPYLVPTGQPDKVEISNSGTSGHCTGRTGSGKLTTSNISQEIFAGRWDKNRGISAKCNFSLARTAFL
ncbi:MAG: hypothetical protein FWB85_11700 [Chitinispirillia bacterium]|nr:hypothetical protein [Chitinispirillia bacterium]MCL2184119.1 hypothetical protein [Chitinispirillia bacterium]